MASTAPAAPPNICPVADFVNSPYPLPPGRLFSQALLDGQVSLASFSGVLVPLGVYIEF